MRDIKFRAWNKEFQNMVYPSLKFGQDRFPCFYKRITQSDFDKDDNLIETLVMELVSVDHILQSPDHFDVMQYTGLDDMNGRNIYEGDILHNVGMQEQIDDDDDVKVKWRALEVVIFNDGCFTTDVKDEFDIVIDNKNCIVIGNIYENKELLTEIEKIEKL